MNEYLGHDQSTVYCDENVHISAIKVSAFNMAATFSDSEEQEAVITILEDESDDNNKT